MKAFFLQPLTYVSKGERQVRIVLHGSLSNFEYVANI